jgi:ribosome-associated protein
VIDKTSKKEKIEIATDKILETVRKAAKIADDRKAEYVKILDMRSRLIITDYFIIIGAKNTRLTRRIQEDISVELKKNGFFAINSGGLNEGNWILSDYNDFVIHIFTEDIRQFYDLERLWKDAEEIKWE